MNVATVPNYATITDLTVTGNIDARDVKFMRDSMTVLARLDLSGATIVAYSGSGGTYPYIYETYSANEMPRYSFCNPSNWQGKTSLVSVQLPADLTSIGDNAFSSCIGLSGSLTFPAGLTSIGDYTFLSCYGLSGSLTFPAGLTSIGGSAFKDCTGLGGSLTFPAGLTSIGASAFLNCNGFTSIINLNPEPASITSDIFSVYSTCTLTVPACA
ncbi:MAG: leucine-rich repeat domain-containing protein [Bacteroidales bacterium]|jgi:hypothetical protein|nr:leucine-rich repeat domain-containing protein [Bacteroidales bacterium]